VQDRKRQGVKEGQVGEKNSTCEEGTQKKRPELKWGPRRTSAKRGADIESAWGSRPAGKELSGKIQENGAGYERRRIRKKGKRKKKRPVQLKKKGAGGKVEKPKIKKWASKTVRQNGGKRKKRTKEVSHCYKLRRGKRTDTALGPQKMQKIKAPSRGRR